MKSDVGPFRTAEKVDTYCYILKVLKHSTHRAQRLAAISVSAENQKKPRLGGRNYKRGNQFSVNLSRFCRHICAGVDSGLKGVSG
jgi:hypothetical protein